MNQAKTTVRTITDFVKISTSYRFLTVKNSKSELNNKKISSLKSEINQNWRLRTHKRNGKNWSFDVTENDWKIINQGEIISWKTSKPI